MNAHAKIPFDAAARVRLAKLLGMMGSSADGEALNAARLADRLVRDAGTTWLDIIALGMPAAAKAPKAPKPPKQARTPRGPKTWCALCRSVASDKTAPPFDREFCRELLGTFTGGEFSRRQIATLREIVLRQRARARERRPA